MSLLARLMEEDGVVWATKSGSNWEAKCVSPAHNDSSPSMSVEVTQGLYQCFGCGIKGNTYTYLTELRGLPKQDARQYMIDNGEWSDEKANYEVKRHDDIKEQSRPKSGLPRQTDRIYDRTRGLPLVKEYHYYNREGRVVMVVGRYEGYVDGDRNKHFFQFTPAKRGGFWACSPLNSQVPKEDSSVRIPLYRLRELLDGDENKPIWVVEGEKCVDAILDNPLNSPKMPLCTSLAGGSSTKIGKVDLTPFRGRKVLLIADGDEKGRAFMERLGLILYSEQDCEVNYLFPMGEDKYDVADAMAHGGWKAVSEWFRTCDSKKHEEMNPVEPLYEPDPFDDSAQGDEGDPFPITDNQHFRILGFDTEGKNVVVQKKSTNTLVNVKSTACDSQGTLINLAPLSFWTGMVEGGLSANNRARLADFILRAAEAQGIHDRNITPHGRGVFLDDEGVCNFNLGDRIFAANANGMLSGEKGLAESPVLLEPGGRVSVLSDTTKAKDYGFDLYQALMQYRFDSEYSARRFCGWLVSSLVGGGLQFRPMIWLSAPAGSGKTYLFEQVCQPLFGGLGFLFENPTPAGVTQSVRSDSLPVIIDEFEPDERNEHLWRDMLGVFRASTSGGFSRARGTVSGNAISIKCRFSAMVASINKPRLAAADESRLAAVKLSTDEVLDWDSLDREIRRAASEKKMSVLRSDIITTAPTILAKVAEVNETTKSQYPSIDTRSLQIHSALTTGAGYLSDEWHTTWRSVEEDDDRDYCDILRYLFAMRVRTHGMTEETLASLLGMVHSDEPVDLERLRAVSILSQYGLRLWDDDVEARKVLLVAYDMPALLNLLGGSQWGKHVALRENLMTIPGVYYPRTTDGGIRRVRFAGQRRMSLAVPTKILEQSGLDVDRLF